MFDHMCGRAMSLFFSLALPSMSANAIAQNRGSSVTSRQTSLGRRRVSL
jgi:hypothetical protein